MKESVCKAYEELPLFLNAEVVAKVLGIAVSSSYELMHEADFPVLKGGVGCSSAERAASAGDGKNKMGVRKNCVAVNKRSPSATTCR